MRAPILVCVFNFAVGLSLALTAAQASPEPSLSPHQLIEQLSEQVKALLREEGEQSRADPRRLYERVTEIVVPHVDFNRMGSLIMGRYWRRASGEQRERFAKEFRRLLLNTYAAAYREFKEWKIEYLPLNLSPEDTDVLVRTEVLQPGGPALSVNYRMHRNDDQWKAYDVAIEGISLVHNYRSAFATEIRKRGIEGFLQQLESHNRKTQAARND